MASQSIISALISGRADHPPKELQFVTVSNPKDITNSTNQQTIRRHVMKRNRRSRRRPISYTFDLAEAKPTVRSYNLKKSCMVRHDADGYQYPVNTETRLYSLHIGVGSELYPHLQLPIEATPRIMALVNFMHRNAAMNYNPGFRYWFAVALTGPSAFYMTLSNSALALARAQADQPTNHISQEREALEFYTLSIQAVQLQLQRPLEEDVPGAILGFAGMDTITGNFSRAIMHLRGLHRVIRLRGGFETVVSRDFRLILLNIDTCASLAQDVPPSFPAPMDLLPQDALLYQSQATPFLKSALERWVEAFIDDSHLVRSILWMSSFASHANEHCGSPRYWTEDRIANHMLFILHQVLSVERQYPGTNSNPGLIAKEATRLTLLVLLGDLKFRLGFPCGTDGDTNRRKLISLLLHHPIDWSPCLELQLWILAVGVAKLEPGCTECTWYVDEIRRTMQRMELTSWNSSIGIIRKLIWIDDLSVYNVQILSVEVDQPFWSKIAPES